MASENGGYRGLLIDWGGVLTTDVFASFSAFCEREGLAPDAISRVFREDAECRELMLGLETGAVAQEQFEPQVAALLGVQPSGLLDRMFAGARARRRDDRGRSASPRRTDADGAPLQLLGNDALPERPARGAVRRGRDLRRGRDAQAQAREIYVLAAERLGLQPADCVFVDDLPGNLAPAAGLGMAIVHHRATEDTIAQLERLFGVSLR